MNLTDKAKKFGEDVKNSREYFELKQAQSLINKNPVLKKKMEDIQRKQQAIMMQYKPGQQKPESEIIKLKQEIRDISAIPEVNSYLTAVNNFNNMMSKLFKIISTTIEN